MINWEVRFKNPVWWASAAPVLIGALYMVLKLLEIAPAVTENELVTAVVSVITVISGLIGSTVDPTTEGLRDSKRAMGYKEPYKNEMEETK